jgi:hypothetical protein
VRREVEDEERVASRNRKVPFVCQSTVRVSLRVVVISAIQVRIQVIPCLDAGEHCVLR